MVRPTVRSGVWSRRVMPHLAIFHRPGHWESTKGVKEEGRSGGRRGGGSGRGEGGGLVEVVVDVAVDVIFL